MRDPKQKKKSREAAAEQQEGSFWKQAALLSGLTAASVLTGLYVQNKRRLDAVEDEEEEEDEIHDFLSVEEAKEPTSSVQRENKEAIISRYNRALQSEYKKQLTTNDKYKSLASNELDPIQISDLDIQTLASSSQDKLTSTIEHIVKTKLDSILNASSIL